MDLNVTALVFKLLKTAVWWKPTEDTVLDQNGVKWYRKRDFGKLTCFQEVYSFFGKAMIKKAQRLFQRKKETSKQLSSRWTPQKHWLEDMNRSLMTLWNNTYIQPFKENETFIQRNWKNLGRKPTAVFLPECKVNQMLPFHICTTGSPQSIQKGWHSALISLHFPVNRKQLIHLRFAKAYP